jgi:outer membrane protein
MTPSVRAPLLPRLAAALVLVATGAAAQQADPEPAPAPPPPPATVWEGAIGLTAAYRPDYQGADTSHVSVTPALFLRYGRFTITNASGFVTKRADDIASGLAMDLVQSERVRLNLAFSIDRGRQESSNAELAGMGDIDPTVRARVRASYRFLPTWRAGINWSVDALGRGGGNAADIGLGWEHRFSPDSLLTAGASLSIGGDRYMQSYYGVTPEQAVRSGHPVYMASAGVRDVDGSVNWRLDIEDRWIVLAGAGVSRLLGHAAASPLTQKRNGWGVNGGIARRF